MIDPQSWPPLCGAVAGCGALLLVSGLGKLAASARRGPGTGPDGSGHRGGAVVGDGDGTGTAVQQLLRLRGSRWRAFQTAAGAAECAVGGWTAGPDAPPVLGDALMAGLGAAFLVLLALIRRAGIAGDCGCLARRRAGRAAATAATPWAFTRAAVVAAAGALGAVTHAEAPFALPAHALATAYAVALLTLVVLAGADLDVRTPRCGRTLLFPTRRTLGEVTGHGTYRAMARSLGATGNGRITFRRTGCVDEFWFPAQSAGPDDVPRYLAISAGHTASGALAVKAAVALRLPEERVRTLRPPRRSPAIAADRGKPQPSARQPSL